MLGKFRVKLFDKKRNLTLDVGAIYWNYNGEICRITASEPGADYMKDGFYEYTPLDNPAYEIELVVESELVSIRQGEVNNERD